MPLAPINGAHITLHHAILNQRAQNTVQRLLGHAQDGQQIIHRRIRRVFDKMQRPVMRPPIPIIGQHAIGIRGETAIGKKHRLNPAAQLLVR